MALYINGQEVSGGSGASSLEDLTDVNITTPTNGQTLVYDSANSEWVNSGNTIGGSPLVTYKATLSSSQYGWFTFVDENGNNLNVKNGVPIMASCLTSGKYYHALMWEYNTSGDFIFKVADINGNYVPIGSSLSNIEFDCAYIKTNMASNIYDPIIYSEDERKIGVWTDGKPLYQKTIIITNASKDANYDLGITDFDTCFVYDGSFGSGIIPYLHGSYPDNSIGGFLDQTGSSLAWAFRCGSLAPATINGFITVRYTKTTDTAGSGQWTPQGVPAIHYSTDEQVVGTWIDGSTIFEKTVDIGTLPATSTKAVAHNISNLDKVLQITGAARNSSNVTLPLPSPGALEYVINVNTDSTDIHIDTYRDRSGFSGYITLRYTKSSS